MLSTAVTFALPYLGLVPIPEAWRAAGRAAVAAGTNYLSIHGLSHMALKWPVHLPHIFIIARESLVGNERDHFPCEGTYDLLFTHGWLQIS